MLFEDPLKFKGRRFHKRRDPHVKHISAENLGAHGAHLNDFSFYGEIERLFILAPDGDFYRRARGASHEHDSFRKRKPLSGFPVDAHDAIAASEAGSVGRCVIDRGEDCDPIVLNTHLDTQSSKFSFCLALHLGEHFFVEIGGMRIEVLKHAFDRVFQQGLLLDVLDVVVLKKLKNLGEFLDFFVGDLRSSKRGACDSAGDSKRRGSNKAHRGSLYPPSRILGHWDLGKR